MTVNLTISETYNGYSAEDTLDAGTLEPGDTSSFQDLFISHDAETNPITDVALYVTRYVGSNYLGEDEDQDLTDLLSWGGASKGIQISMVRDNPWTEGAEFSTGWSYISSGYGDSDNQITLDADSLVLNPSSDPGDDGEIPVGDTAHIQLKITIPDDPGTPGYKAFNLVVAYSATS